MAQVDDREPTDKQLEWPLPLWSGTGGGLRRRSCDGKGKFTTGEGGRSCVAEDAVAPQRGKEKNELTISIGHYQMAEKQMTDAGV